MAPGRVPAGDFEVPGGVMAPFQKATAEFLSSVFYENIFYFLDIQSIF